MADLLKLFREQAEAGGGAEKQHSKGKLTARERIELLVDRNSFLEIDKLAAPNRDAIPGDGVVTGAATIDGRKVFLFSQDFTVYGGSLATVHAQKICKVMDLAVENGCPIIGINDSGGARIQDGVASLGGYADIFLRNTAASGVIPQISLIMGPCAGGAVYSPAITDFIVMVQKTSHLFITGPDVIKQVTKEVIDKEALGGARAHFEKSGVTHLVYPTDENAIRGVKTLLSYLPNNNLEKSDRKQSFDPIIAGDDAIERVLPEKSTLPYDVREIIIQLVDSRSFFELQSGFAQNIITGFARFSGRSVGIVANQPNHLAGCLDIDASTKAARFVRFCDAFNIPLVTLVDVPGFLPGSDQEHGGIIRHGAKLLYAYAEATVPKLTVILRKAYGGAYDVMSSKHLRGDFNFAWPTAEIAVMGSEGAIQILNRKELSETDPAQLQEKIAHLKRTYEREFLNPWSAARLGFIDDVIYPSETRTKLIQALEITSSKKVTPPKRKHGNIPL